MTAGGVLRGAPLLARPPARPPGARAPFRSKALGTVLPGGAARSAWCDNGGARPETAPSARRASSARHGVIEGRGASEGDPLVPSRNRNGREIHMRNTIIATAALAALGTAALAQDMDADGDGLITYEELIVAMPDVTEETFTLADTNVDGGLDPDEYQAAIDAGLITVAE